jgi:hypothetical protein
MFSIAILGFQRVPRARCAGKHLDVQESIKRTEKEKKIILIKIPTPKEKRKSSVETVISRHKGRKRKTETARDILQSIENAKKTISTWFGYLGFCEQSAKKTK